jgi:hypothetical protein
MIAARPGGCRALGSITADLRAMTLASDTRVQAVAAQMEGFVAPLPMAFIDRADAEAHSLTLPVVLDLEHLDKRVTVWLFALQDDDEPSEHSSAGSSGTPSDDAGPNCYLSPRVFRRLGASRGDAVSLLCPPRAHVTVAPAFAHDIPAGLDIHADPAVTDAVSTPSWIGPNRALLSSGTLCVPVRVRARPGKLEAIRVSMHTRVLAAVQPGASVQISPLPARPVNRTTRPWSRIARRLDWLVEHLLRVLLRAPTLQARTVQAPIGDDTENIVRCPQYMFAMLGIEEGDEVLVEWADRCAVAVALEPIDGDIAFQPTDSVLAAQGVGRLRIPRDAPTHLVVRIASPVRSALQIPAATVVTIRRRVRPYFANRLGRATLPLVGVAFAALAIPVKHNTALIVSLVVIVALQVLSLRYPRPPKGRWPR